MVEAEMNFIAKAVVNAASRRGQNVAELDGSFMRHRRGICTGSRDRDSGHPASSRGRALSRETAETIGAR
jgi:hypothetical protein